MALEGLGYVPCCHMIEVLERWNGAVEGRVSAGQRLDELHPWDQRSVKLAHPLATERFELFQASLALPDELGDVYALSFRLELLEALCTVAQETRGPAPVTVLLVVEAHADLEDALVEEADPPRFLHPGLLEVLVTLVEFAPVELLYALEGEFGELSWGFHPGFSNRSRNPRRNSRRRTCARPSRGS